MITSIKQIARSIARWLDPETYDERERIEFNLRQVAEECGYAFPTVRVVRDWVLNHDPDDEAPPMPPGVEAIYHHLEHEYSGPEPEELSGRLEATLHDTLGGERD